MHKLILWFFKNAKNIVQFLSIICSFFVAVISLCWVEVIIGVNWTWLHFIKPVINPILDFSGQIMPLSFNFFGTDFDMKYLISIALLFLLVYLCRKALDLFLDLEVDYHNMHNKIIKSNEKSFNKNLVEKINTDTKKTRDYMVLITTQWKANYYKKANDNFGEQNNIMNEFLYNQTGIKHSVFDNGFLYKFDDFESLDNTLEILFRLFKSQAPLDYAISIQIGDGLQAIKKLADMKMYDKIIISAETLYRYNLNKKKSYKTESVGIFQDKQHTLEVHEFKE
jgi:hypothetical protein